jgi:formylglycine-generating enzyme required for sulfatase activity
MGTRRRIVALLLLTFAWGCSGEDPAAVWWVQDGSAGEHSDDAQAEEGAVPEAGTEAQPEAPYEAASHDAQQELGPEAAAPCPMDMQQVGASCVDRFEAPNVEGQLPLVMFHFNEAESWCGHRGKRLCFDDEWTTACEGPQKWSYPYGEAHQPGVCNDDKPWKAYNQELLNGWPWSLETDAAESLEALLDAARTKGAAAKAAADHVQALYQGAPSGTTSGCVGTAGVYDLTGNVEEWTRRRDGGEASFHGKLKGRYWSEPRTCQMGVVTHGDTFRFYEIGFRCCSDASTHEP